MSEKKPSKSAGRWRAFVDRERQKPEWETTIRPALDGVMEAVLVLHRAVGARGGDYLMEIAQAMRDTPEMSKLPRSRLKRRGGVPGTRRRDADQELREIYWRHVADAEAGAGRLNLVRVAREAKASIGAFRNTDFMSVRRHLDRVLVRLVAARRKELAAFMNRDNGSPKSAQSAD